MVQSREEKSLYNKQYYQDNRKKIIKQVTKYAEDHREERIKYQKIYSKKHYLLHIEEKSESARKWYKKNRDNVLIKTKKYNKEHPEIRLKSQIKTFTELGKKFDLGWDSMRWANQSWSLTIKKRDNHKCTWCNSTENLVAHHIWHKIFCPESALDVDNGITLCHDCHMEQHRLDRRPIR